MTPEQALKEAESGDLRPVYLIVGNEPYFEAEVLSALKRAGTRGGVPGLNDETLTAGEVTVDRVLAAARTLPMMAKRRLLVVRGLERWEPREGAEKMATTPSNGCSNTRKIRRPPRCSSCSAVASTNGEGS